MRGDISRLREKAIISMSQSLRHGSVGGVLNVGLTPHTTIHIKKQNGATYSKTMNSCMIHWDGIRPCHFTLTRAEGLASSTHGTT